MRRADRLIKIVHFLRHRHRAVTAQRIGEEFEISTRTVYRDLQDLMDSGVPVSGEAGVGYVIDKKYYLPPIAFDADELEAIGLGMNMVRQWTDDQFAAKANSAMEKIYAVLPVDLKRDLEQITTYAMPGEPELPWEVSFSAVRECIREKRKMCIDYRDGKKQQTTRIVRPLALMFFSPVWVVAGWCEKRNDFRHFRLDRIVNLHHCASLFNDDNEKNLAAYVHSDSACQLSTGD